VQQGRRPKQHPVHDREHGDVRPDAQRQREDHTQRETRAARELTRGVAQVGEESVYHSCLRATSGSTFVARRAGSQLARRVAARRSSATAASVTGSRGPTSNNRSRSRPVTPKAQAPPTTNPPSVTNKPRDTTRSNRAPTNHPQPSLVPMRAARRTPNYSQHTHEH